MRRSWEMIVRMFCVVAMAATGLTATATAATAADPPRWGFAVIRSDGSPDYSRQGGSWPGGYWVQTTLGGPGQVFVRFPQIGRASGGVAHVTAITLSADWCQVEGWWQSGADEIVAVQCHRHGVGPIASWFSLSFGDSSQYLSMPQAFGYVHWDGSAVVSRFNSSGPAAVNTVEPTSLPGAWWAVLPGFGSEFHAGNIQVTAVDPSVPARCKVAGWQPTPPAQRIVVRCYDATGAPLNTGWSLTYHRERPVAGPSESNRFAYTFHIAFGTSVSPMTMAYLNYNSRGGTVQISSNPDGPKKQVVFTAVGGTSPDNVQVTAVGYNAEFCNLSGPWVWDITRVMIRHVACYDGNRKVDHSAMVTYAAR